VKCGSRGSENTFTSEVKLDSPKQILEHLHSNSSAPSIRHTGDRLSVTSSTALNHTSINWNGWADWLGKKTKRDIAECWTEIFSSLDRIARELNVSAVRVGKGGRRLAGRARAGFDRWRSAKGRGRRGGLTDADVVPAIKSAPAGASDSWKAFDRGAYLDGLEQRNARLRRNLRKWRWGMSA